MRMRVGVFVGCFVLALSATPALAKKKHKKKGLGPVVTATATGNVVNTPGGVSTATATCPNGKQAVGGGYSTPPLDGNNAIFVLSSIRSSQRGWTVSALVDEGAGSVTAFAYCRNKSKPISDVASTGTVPSGGGAQGAASATCPPGSRLVSGGFDITHGPANSAFAVAVSSQTTTPGVWSVVAVNNTNGAHVFTTHAYCMTGIAAPKVVNASTSATGPALTPVSVSSPTCPKPKKRKGKKKKPAQLLTAGGFASQASPPIAIFSESRINSNVWLNSGSNVTGPTGTVPASSQGICV